MTTDVGDLTTFYADLPSIFENNSSSSIESSYNTIVTDVNTEKSYQPMFGSFLFADSDPLSKAAFVASSSRSFEIETTQERLMDDCASSDKNNISSIIQTTLSSSSSPLSSTPMEDIDEDDFDGIPIRHAPVIIKKKLNGDSNLILNHSNHDNLFNEFVDRIENSHDDNDIEDDSFLNDFTDEQDDPTAIVSSLFKDIPDIDDPNEHEEDNDDDDRIPFDHMDLSDQSDSIRSSSPDSLLSSSHLQDDDMDVNDEVEQWNDDVILDTNSSNTNPQINRENPSLNLPTHPFDQVDFIDTSRSNSRCSNVSSNLSIGYADQARTFMSDEEVVSSSDSDDNDNNDNIINFDCDTFSRDENEDICLQVNLDNHRSVSAFSKSNSTRSSSPIPDETPIVDIDEDTNELKNLQIAPIAALDDEDDDDLQTFISDQPILTCITSNKKNLIEFKTEKRQNEIVHDIVNIRHLINDNDHDDEFIAIMHNPKMFEEVLYDDNQKKSESIKQTNSVTSTFRLSTQLSIDDNKIKKESFEHHQNIHDTSSFLESDNETTPNSSFYTRKTTTTTNSSSPPDVNHLVKEREENNGWMNVVNSTDILKTKQKKEQLHNQPTNNTSNINVKRFTNNKKYIQIMNTDNESEDDLELLKTLSQIHGIINPIQSFEETNQIESQMSSYSTDINHEKHSSNFSSKNRIINGNETELINEKKQVSSHILPSSSYVINTIKQSDEERKEKNEKKNVIFHKNHNYVYGDDKKKEKYERREEEKKKATTLFSLTSSTSPILFNDDSFSSVAIVDPDTSFSLPNLLLLSSNKLNESTLFANQLITDDLQISSTKSNMSDLSNDELTQQITSNIFDPFAPTTTTNMFDDEKKSNLNSTQPLANYNFDDLWNQSISHIDSSNNESAWNEFLNNNNNNTEKSNSPIPTTNITWESLFGEEQEEQEEDDENDLKKYLNWILSHLNDSEPIITFTSTQNLESIIKDIQMSTLPFEPMPSPPLHIDHTVANPLINAIHHELFPIDELEQPNITQGQQSMILYEEDEEEQPNKFLSFDDEVKPIVEKLVSDILQLALIQVNESYQQIDHFIDQILSQAIFEVYNEDINSSNDITSTENLASIISWHDQTKATNKQLPDPFDKKFDSVWSSHFHAPDDTTNENIFENENKNLNDPWLMTTSTESTKDADSMAFLSKTFDDLDLFSSSNNPINKIQEMEDDDTNTLSEYLPPPLLTNASNATTAANNLMKYTLTAPVMDDSGDDSSTLEDYFISRKNTKFDESKNMTEQDNFFSNKGHLSQFDVFASDQPLHSPEIESKFSNITSQFDEEFNVSSPIDDNAPWTSIEKPIETNKSSGIGDDEPWELEDNGEEKLTPIPTTTKLSSTFNDNEDSPIGKVNLHNNFFSDSFNPNENAEHTLTKTVRFDDNVQNIRAPTPPKNTIESSTSDSDEVEIDDITPNFETINDRMETSYVNIDETDLKTERPYESIELSPQIANTRLNDQINPSNDNIPSSNTETQYKINLRSESELTTPPSNTDTQLVQPYPSVL